MASADSFGDDSAVLYPQKDMPPILEATLAIISFVLLFLGLGGALFIIGRGHIQQRLSVLGIVSFAVLGIGLIGTNLVITLYLRRIYNVGFWRQVLRLRGTNLRQGITAFGPQMLRIDARRVGLVPDAVVRFLYSLIALDIIAFVIGRITR